MLGELWRSIIRWPLYSPRRLALTVLAVVAVLVAVARVVQPATGSPLRVSVSSSPAAAISSSPAATATPTVPVTTTPVALPPLPRADEGAAEWVAVAFVTAWADHHAGARWLTGVRRYAHPQLAAELRTVDPRNVPAHRVTGQPGLVDGGGDSAVVRVPTDAGPVTVTVVRSARAWQVVEIVGGVRR
jgi:hypothetical protein